jgi:hypothetical protein
MALSMRCCPSCAREAGVHELRRTTHSADYPPYCNNADLEAKYAGMTVSEARPLIELQQ